jgi:hypothetical protein
VRPSQWILAANQIAARFGGALIGIEWVYCRLKSGLENKEFKFLTYDTGIDPSFAVSLEGM